MLHDLAEDRSGPAPESASSGEPLATLRQQAEAWSGEQAFQALSGLTTALASDLDTDSLVKRVLADAIRVFGADRGILFLGHGDAVGLVPVLGVNVQGEEIENLEAISRTILAKGEQGEVLITQDAMADPRLHDVPSVQINKMHSVLCAPLVHRTQRIGAIYLDATRPDAFPPNTDRLLRAFSSLTAIALENARVHGAVLLENARLRRRQPPESAFDALVGSSQTMEALRHRARIAAQVDGPILIMGERGSGREVLARAIHDSGYRTMHPFVSLDCSAVPSDDLAGSLFGRTGSAAARGTGEKAGILSAADHGTLYLGEVEHLDAEIGQRLVTALHDYSYRPVGGHQPIHIDVRIIMSTSKDLNESSEFDYFCKELYRWARGLSMRVPPLRERMSDIPELVAHFVMLHTSSRRKSVSMSPDALDYLQKHVWPGNVEELEHVIRRAMLLSEDRLVTERDVDRAMLPSPEVQDLLYGPWTGRVVPLSTWEREAIRQALLYTRGNRSEASKLLGVHRNTLVRKVREYGLE